MNSKPKVTKSNKAIDAAAWRDRAPEGSEERCLFDEACQTYWDATMMKPAIRGGSAPVEKCRLANKARRLYKRASALRDERMGWA